MIDNARARRLMVDTQIRPADVTDHAVIAAFGAVPRERFVPPAQRFRAYADGDIPIGQDDHGPRYLAAATMQARLVQLAGIGPDDVVLDIGCGTGYLAAVMARLSTLVVALESDERLSAAAADALADAGVDNAATVTGPLVAGYPAEGPYDVILFEGAVDLVPESIFDQLRDGGRLVAVIGSGGAAQANLFTRSGADVAGRAAFNAALPRLPGFSRPPVFSF